MLKKIKLNRTISQFAYYQTDIGNHRNITYISNLNNRIFSTIGR